MDVFEILKFIFVVSTLLLLILLYYYKLKKIYNISFNSYYLLTVCIISLILYNLLSFKIFSLNIEFYVLTLLTIFFIAYTLKTKRLLDCISLSEIFKSQKLKNKSAILFDKSYYSFETMYLFEFIILSLSLIISFYYLQKITIEKYILIISSILIFIFFSFKIVVSDIQKKLKKNYILEIILFLSLFINLIYFGLNLNTDSYFNHCIIFILEILFLISLITNFGISSRAIISEDKFILKEKLESNFYLFFNNELCFYFFYKYLDKIEQDSKILIKIYLDISKYKLKLVLNENCNEIRNTIDFFDNNKQFIKNPKLKEKLEIKFESIKKFINENNYENNKNIFDKVFSIIDDIFNKKYKIFKGTKEYEELFSFINLIYFLDEYIYIESFYFNYINNEELQNI